MRTPRFGARGLDIEWITLAVLLGCYAAWAAVLWWHAELGPWLTVALLAPLVTLHSSLQHEALHGHPSRSHALNELLVFLPLGLLYPYRRFKMLHLRHHNDAALTDPYDDPESFYYAMADWQRLPGWTQRILDFNNTFSGRFLIGPAVMAFGFIGRDMQLIAGGERDVARAWAHHLLGLAILVTFIIGVCGMSPGLYVAAGYLGLSILNVRTFAEHQAHESEGGRTVIVETSPVFGLLFLNNNLHYVHHENPRVPWYRLPALYRANRADLLAANESYSFGGYGEMIRRYLFRSKSAVPHPFLRRG